MATLTLTGSGFQDHTADTLNNVSAIVFQSSGPIVAQFFGSQFDNVQISTSVNITCDDNFDRLVLALSTTSLSAANWTFTNYNSASFDRIQFGGTTGNDTITGSSVRDYLLGGAGNDVLDGGGDFDVASYFFDGPVTVTLAIAGQQNTGSAGLDTLTNIEGLEGSLTGGDQLTGNQFNNSLQGWGGDDVLTAGAGLDYLSGGLGRDTLTGGADADIFDFNLKAESVKGAKRDVITDFSGVQGGLGEFDVIDLQNIDAKKGHGNQAFHFIGKQAFHHKAGELQVKYHAATDVGIVSGDINGDGKADFQIEVHSTAALVKADFLL